MIIEGGFMSGSFLSTSARRNTLIHRAVALALAAAAYGAAPAYAQEQESTEAVSEVVITGSRIIREGMSSPTPVTALTSEELLQNNPQSLSQALSELPSMTNSTTPQSMGGRSTLGPGSFLNLRNLGTNRNLVLLDGRRVVPSNIAGNTDINLLPQGLVSNISVVTGGASAAYGSDAVAGVTNFILNTRYEGLKFDANLGGSSHDFDGQSKRAAVAWGDAFLDNRLHLIGSFDWRRTQQAYKENREWADDHCAVVPVPGVNVINQSATNPRQTVACGVTQPNASYGGAIISGPLVKPTEGITFGPGGTPMPFLYGTLRSTNLQVGGSGNFVGDTANFNTPTDNKVFFGHALYDITDSTNAFLQLTVGRADAQYTQTPAYFFGATPLRIYSGNPYIPASIQQRMTALSVSTFDLNIVPKSWGTIDLDSNYRAWDAVAGLKGKIGDTWNWDAYYENGRTSFRLGYRRQISLSRLYRAVDAVVAPNGSIVCQSALANPSAYGDCVPLNPFGTGKPSQAALDYIYSDEQPFNYNVMRQQVAATSISGEPFALWAGPVSIGAGVEWRKLEGEVSSDFGSNTVPNQAGIRYVPPSLAGRVGDWSTSNVLPLEGDYDVKEGFVETLVPLAHDVPMARTLDLNGAFRYTDYSQSGAVHTWKAGLTWKPIDELMVRATRSRDIRAPGIGDLYSKDSSGPNTIVNYTPPGGTQTSVSTPILLSGNPALQPEKADTSTYGFTYEPAWLDGFGTSVDYYDIKIDSALATVSAQETVDRCGRGQQLYCDNLIISNGQLVGIRQRTMNLSEARTRGVDVDFSYRTTLSGAKTVFRLLGTRLLEQSTTVPNASGATFTDRVGDMSLGYPKWLLIGSTNVDIGAFGFNVNARYIDGGKYNTTYVDGDLDPRYTTVASNLTFDVGAHFGIESTFGSPEVYLNIANVFDRDPPLIPSSALVGGQTNVSLYDTLGRYYTAGVRMRF
jgi:iron complex outermembrane recepter protein